MDNSYLNTIPKNFSHLDSIRVQFRSCRINIHVLLTFKAFSSSIAQSKLKSHQKAESYEIFRPHFFLFNSEK